MRLHRVHFEGLRSPRGSHAFLFRPGYNAVVSADPAQTLDFSRLLEGLLYPEELGPLGAWCARAGPDRARAALEFEASGDAYRIVVDFAVERLGVGRSGPGVRGYRLIASGLREVGACLDSLGRPPGQVFGVLCGPGPGAAEAAADQKLRHPSAARPEPDPEAPGTQYERDSAAAELAWAERRREELAPALSRIEALRAEQAELEAGLEERRAITSVVGDDELSAGLQRFRELSVERGAERASLAAKRQEFREQRERLRAATSVAFRWILVAAATCLAAAGGAYLGGVSWRPFALLCLGLSVVALLRSRSSRRARARIDARAAALSVRERMLDGSYGFEIVGVPRLLAELGFKSVEALEAAVREVRDLSERHDAISRELGKARELLSEDGEEELRELELRLVELSRGQAVAEVAREEGDFGESVRGVAAWLGGGEARLVALALPALEPYLMDLSDGHLSAPLVDDKGWAVCVDGAPDPCPLARASAGNRARFELALRFALVEQLAESRRFPFLIGPELPAGLAPDSWPELARALERLAAGVQVVQAAPLEAAWVERATAIHPL